MVSIHTMQFNISCIPADFSIIFNAVYNYNKALHRKVPPDRKKKMTKYTFQCYREIGITRFEFINTKVDGCIQKHITLVVNPKLLLGETHLCYSTIVEPERILEVKNKLLDFLNGLSSNIKIFAQDITISRIDYCTNFWFCDQDTADKYMMLLERFRPRKSETQKLYPHPTRHRREPREGEITLCGVSYEFSIYKKHTQLDHYRHSAKDLNNEEDYVYSEGQIRIEYRAMRSSVYRHKRKKGVFDDLDLLSDDFDAPMGLIINKLYSMYGKGDFYKKRYALELIRNSGFGKKVQSNMIKIIETVSKARSLDPDLNGIPRKKLSRYINQYFNKINLSPIVIPKDWGEKKYPNPARYIGGESTYLLRDNADTASTATTEMDIDCSLKHKREAPES